MSRRSVVQKTPRVAACLWRAWVTMEDLIVELQDHHFTFTRISTALLVQKNADEYASYYDQDLECQLVNTPTSSKA